MPSPEQEAALKRVGRRTLGFDSEGTSAAPGAPASELLRAAVLGLHGGVVLLAVVMWPFLADGILTTLGFGQAWLLPLFVLGALVLGGVMTARWAVGEDRRWVITVATAAAAGGFAIGALAGSVWLLVAAAVMSGIAASLGWPAQYTTVMESSPPVARLRAIATFHSTTAIVVAGATFLMSTAGSPGAITWRAVLVIFGAGTLLVACTGLVIGGVRTERSDAARMAHHVYEEAGGSGALSRPLKPDEVALHRTEQFRRVLSTRCARPALLLSAATGLVVGPLPAYHALLLAQQFGTSRQRATALFGVVLVGAAAGSTAVAFGWLGTRPVRLLRPAGRAVVIAGVALALAAWAPTAWISVGLLAVTAAGLWAALPATGVALLSAVHPRYRPHASLLLAAAAIAGAMMTRNLMDSIASRFGVRWAIAVIACCVVAAGIAALDGDGAVIEDVDAVIGQIIEEAEVDVIVSRGQHLPLLRCRGIDFSYAQLQVLFGVDFSVDDGEMVALLGTNGAGKSTLLRTISGVGFPARGSIHFRGSDITHVAPDRRVVLGISQLPGGKAVFPPLSVVDNLRVFGYMRGRDRRSLDAGIDASFEVFPQLAERRNQLAATLSGGEQQMLALTRAFLLQPRLLLIDELSLGLAPNVVGQLLEMVRGINAQGASVVLVEQSVNIALSLVNHAYFMEKGAVRFDGRASDMLERPDLLRSVFLEGAVRAVGGSVAEP